MKAIKFFLGIFLIITLFFSKEAIATDQDSFTLFYPIVAGKTQGDSFYFLKTFRDQLTEVFSFGNAKKSEVNLTLATKRFLEGEKLLKNNQNAFAKTTFENFTAKLTAAYNYAATEQDNDTSMELLIKLQDQVNKFQIILEQNKNSMLLNETIAKVTEIQNKIKADIERSSQ